MFTTQGRFQAISNVTQARQSPPRRSNRPQCQPRLFGKPRKQNNTHNASTLVRVKHAKANRRELLSCPHEESSGATRRRTCPRRIQPRRFDGSVGNRVQLFDNIHFRSRCRSFDGNKGPSSALHFPCIQ